DVCSSDLVESPEVYPGAISRAPQHFIDAGHPAGCRTLFQAPGGDDAGGAGHEPLGYEGETKAFGVQMADTVANALDTASYASSTNDIWGRRADVCLPVETP